MLYLGIDVHRKQLTVSVRNEAGEVVVRRHAATKLPPKGHRGSLV